MLLRANFTEIPGKGSHIALPIQMRYKIVSRDVGARHCRALTDVLTRARNAIQTGYILYMQQNSRFLVKTVQTQNPIKRKTLKKQFKK
jgi:hypothetical protein